MADNSDIPPPSNGHVWFLFHKFICCAKCGIVRRADDKNQKCKGNVKVTLRGEFRPREKGESK